MKSKQNNCTIMVVFLLALTSSTFAASFITLSDHMNWDVNVSSATISDDASTIIVSYGCSGSALWKSGDIIDISGCSFYGMTRDGSIVVGSQSGQAFTYQSGTFNYLGDGVAYGISDNGSVVSGRTSSSDTGQACIWNNGVREDIPFLKSSHLGSTPLTISGNGLTVVGISENPYHQPYQPYDMQTFIWSGTTAELFPGPGGIDFWYPRAASYDGTVFAGTYSDGSRYQSCIYSDGSTHAIEGLTGHISSSLSDITADGSIAVGYGYAQGYEYDAIIWDEINGTQLLKSFLENNWGLDLTDWSLRRAYGISEDGTMIYGNGVDPDGNGTYWIAEIPEPATILLFGIGGITLIKNRRNNLKR